MADYQRFEEPMGEAPSLDVAHPIDMLQPGRYAVLQNLRSYTRGQLELRPGLVQRNPGINYGSAVHSMHRLNDYISSTSALIVGAGTGVFNDSSAVAIDTGYSGSPITFVPFRPNETPRPWLYIGDSNKMSKTKVGATFARSIGTPSPTVEPLANFGASNYKVITDTSSTTGWAVGVAAGPLSVQNRINDTIAQIVFDSGATGWASVSLTKPDDNVQPGTLVTLSGTEQVLIQSVYQAIQNTTISAIQYDSGSTGMCTVVLADSVNKLILDYHTMIQVGSDNAVVLAVSWSPDNLPCLRLNLANTHAVGDTVTGLISFRAFCTMTHASGDTATATNLKSVTTGGSTSAPIHANYNYTGTIPDLRSSQGRPIGPEDFLHVSFFISDTTMLKEVLISLDVDAVPANQDFKHNALQKTFGPSDFATIATDSDSGLTQLQQRENNIQNRLQAAIAAQNAASQKGQAKINRLTAKLANIREQIADYGGDLNLQFSSQTKIGSEQWTEMFISIAELEAGRIGSDMARDLGNVDGFQVKCKLFGPVTIKISDIWIGGTYGPDVGDIGTPYQWRYRWRSSETGVYSAPSPPLRTGIQPHRESVILTPSYSIDPQIDQIEWERFGGSLDEWNFVGTQPNSGTFTDTYLDDEINAQPGFIQNDYQPFVIQDVPASGTCNVVGVSVIATAGTFNLNWAEGTEITLGSNSTPFTLSGPPISMSFLLLAQNAGVLTGVPWKIDTPILTGVPLPIIFGPYGYGQAADYLFGIGDLKNPGRLYWTEGNNFDSATDRSWSEITSPSEPLLTGGIYQGIIIIGSSDRMFQVNPAFAFDNQNNPLPNFVASEIPNSKGCINHWSMCVGDKGVYFISGDGIYMTYGPSPQSITDDQLYPLFPHEGVSGQTVNGIAPPDFTQLNFLRLSYAEGYVYFDFKDTNGDLNTLVFNTALNTWVFDDYTPEALVHYEEDGSGVISTILGGSDGAVYQFEASTYSDNGTAIAYAWRSRAANMGDPRVKKLLGDAYLDFNSGGQNVTVTPGFDNYTDVRASQILSEPSRKNTPIDIEAGVGLIRQNATLDIVGSATSAVNFYYWGWTYVVKTEDSLRRYSDLDNLGYHGPKFIHGVRIHADTNNVARQIIVQAADGTNGVPINEITLTVQHNGESIIDYDFNPPFIAHMVRLAPQDAILWRLYGDYEFQFDVDSPLVKSYISQGTANDLGGYQHIRDGYIAHISTADIQLTFSWDGITQTSIVIPSSGGVFAKTYFVPPYNKWKIITYSLVSTQGFRLYKRACEVRVRSWGASGPYQTVMPFGEAHYTEGPRI